ncbi:MAG: DUF1553 domain-containing protein [Gemmataceae bacterium]|nr:DUF1553 domain-containing protein [Gemmataceae bacterium]
MRPVALLILFAIVSKSSAAEPVDYLRDIKPILKDRCYACHGALAQKAELRLDSGKGIHNAVTPGKPNESVLLERVSEKEESARMPPEGVSLTAEQIAKLKTWIEQGAKYPADDKPEPSPQDHWAFRKPVKNEPPSVTIPAFNPHPVDRFVAAEWAKRKLEPRPETDKRNLLRRLHLDLTGLPPSAERIAKFLKDESPDAYEKEVDRLLASPQYGERWARHFLDVWRYSDWWGLGAEVRNSQKHMWHWRDWAVESFNADKGYDSMVREMLAADELHPTDENKLRATGYLARQYFLFNRDTWLDETVEHTSKAFLGLTWNCARCHDHKYDPIAQEDYYRFRAIFEPYQVRADMVPGVADFEKDGLPRVFDCNANAPTYLYVRGDDKRPVKDKPIPPGMPKFLAPNGLAISTVKLPAEAHAPQIREHVLATHLALAKPEGEVAERAVRARYEADRAKVTGTPEEAKAKARLSAKAEKELELVRAERAVAKAEADLAKTVGIRRIGPARKLQLAQDTLAKAKKARENPGETYTSLRGSLKTKESNLETEASRAKPYPTTSTGRRSALANWIASRDNPLTARVLVNHVWLRHFGRPLVANVFDFGRKGQSPTHPELLDWLAVDFMEHGWSIKHLHRRIVTSRVYRLGDTPSEANRSIDPENVYLWKRSPLRMDAPTVRDSLLALAGELDATLGGPAVPPNQQTTNKRRSLYFFQSHNEHDKFLSIFDDANVLDCYRRTESIVPQQALALSNSRFAMEMAGKIAAKINADTDAAFVKESFERILGYTPSQTEASAALEALAEFRKLAPATARARLALALVNHNDFVTIR